MIKTQENEQLVGDMKRRQMTPKIERDKSSVRQYDRDNLSLEYEHTDFYVNTERGRGLPKEIGYISSDDIPQYTELLSKVSQQEK